MLYGLIPLFNFLLKKSFPMNWRFCRLNFACERNETRSRSRNFYNCTNIVTDGFRVGLNSEMFLIIQIQQTNKVPSENSHCPYSIWNDFIDKACRSGRLENVVYFLGRVKKELGNEQLKRLTNHDVNNGSSPAFLHIRIKMIRGTYGFTLQDAKREYPMLAEIFDQP